MLDFCGLLLYTVGMKLKDLNQFNQRNINPHRIHLNGGISYPTVTKYLAGEATEPTVLAIVGILQGMGVDWRCVRLGELLEDSPKVK